MKILTTTLFLLAVLLGVQAQQPVSIEWGKANQNKSAISRILGEAGDDVVVLANKNNDFFIEIYDQGALGLKETSPMVLPEENGKRTEIEHIHFFPSTKKILLFTKQFYKQKNYLYCYDVSLEGQISNGRTLIAHAVSHQSLRGNFGFKATYEEEHILAFHYTTVRKEKEWGKQTKVIVLDNQGTILSQIDGRMPYAEGISKLVIRSFAFDGERYVHMLVSKVMNPHNASKRYTEFYIYSYDITKDNHRKKQVIKLEEGFSILDMSFTIDQDQSLVLVGYYAAYAGFWKGLTYQGTFVARYNPETKEILSNTKDSYTPAQYEHAYGKRAKVFKKGLPPYYRIREIILQDDGQIYLISEYVYISQSRGSTSYIYGDISVTLINATGKIEWLSSIPKGQVYTRLSMGLSDASAVQSGLSFNVGISFYIMKDKSIYLSYVFNIKDGNMYFIYNDNPKNIATDISEQPKLLQTVEKGVPTLVIMDREGNMKREVLYGAKNDELHLRPRILKHMDDGSIYIYGNKKKLDKIGRITFN